MIDRTFVGAVGAGDNMLPLGVSSVGQEFIFAAAVPENVRTGKRECSLLLYHRGKQEPTEELPMEPVSGQGDICAVKVSGLSVSDYEYNYKIEGVVVTDPYAKTVRGNESYGNVCGMTRGVIVTERFDWGEDVRPAISSSDVVLYKLHVRGFTKHPSSGVQKKGTFAGVAEKIPYLKELGINAVLLMPCTEYLETQVVKAAVGHSAEFLSIYKTLPAAELAEEKFRRQQGEEQGTRVNYWGYGTKGWYFAPKASYAYDTADPATEYKRMVKQFHEAGIEVWMEFDFDSSVSGSLILDCLRYWTMQYHVDGFRMFGANVPYTLLASDPYLKSVRMLADSWAREAYAFGNLSASKRLSILGSDFSYQARSFLRGDIGYTSDIAMNMKRNPAECSIVNYITDNNGFTLNDLYSYERKHNEANGEHNRDGENVNCSMNCGEEGPARRKAVMDLRMRMVKNALLILFTAQSIPLLYAGDEWLNSQDGNNNAYCQDNEIGWVDWKKTKSKQEIYEYTKRLITLRREHSILHEAKELTGMDLRKTGRPDVSFHGTKAWFPDYGDYSHAFAILYHGEYASRKQNSLYVIYNMHGETLNFDLPKPKDGHAWKLLLGSGTDEEWETEENNAAKMSTELGRKDSLRVKGRTVLVLEESQLTEEGIE